jgi:hypothetical protein
MYGLARYLDRRGHRTELFGYAATLRSFAAITERLHRRLERIDDTGEPWGVIGHSLGGLLLRAALPGLRPRHFVMLGVPNRCPRLARRMRRFWPYRLINGDPGQRLADEQFFAELPVPLSPYTIIAGTAGPVGRWSPFGPDRNDGLVAVDETRIRDDDRPVLLPVGHTFMMTRRSVRAAVTDALAGPDD